VAGKGGGSWKVAYADFVTAMMAFFLVMWIGAQDVKVRQSVANYFIDPSGVDKRPAKQGAALDSIQAGPVPDENKVSGGRGTNVPSSNAPPSPPTSTVLDWIRGDGKRTEYWKAQVSRCRVEASQNTAVNETRTQDEIVLMKMEQLLQSELTKEIQSAKDVLHKELLYNTLTKVNYRTIALDLMTK
jgi:flagellar motor protein MotB